MSQEVKIRYRITQTKNEEATGSIISGVCFNEREFTCVKTKNGVRYIPVENIVTIDAKRKIRETGSHNEPEVVMHG